MDESKTGSDTGSECDSLFDSSSEDLRLTPPPTSSPPRASVTPPFKKRRHNLDNAILSPNETEDTTATINNNTNNNYSYQAGHFPYMFPTPMYSTPERPFLQLPMPGSYKCLPAATNPNVMVSSYTNKHNDSSSDSEKSTDEGKRDRDTILKRRNNEITIIIVFSPSLFRGRNKEDYRLFAREITIIIVFSPPK